MRMHRALIRLLSFAGLCACASIALPARAQNAVEQFYRGKTVTILIGHPAGGSYDCTLGSRAAHLGRFIPGNRRFWCSRARAAAAPAQSSSSTPSDRGRHAARPLHRNRRAHPIGAARDRQWRVQDFAYVGSFANVNSAFMMRKDSAAKSIEDMRHIETKAGCNSRLGQSYVNYALLKAYGGFKFHIVCVTRARWSSPWCSPEARSTLFGGVERLEAWPDVLDGTLRPVISPAEAARRIADIPLMQELLDDPKHKQVAEFLSSASTIGRALWSTGPCPASGSPL